MAAKKPANNKKNTDEKVATNPIMGNLNNPPIALIHTSVMLHIMDIIGKEMGYFVDMDGNETPIWYTETDSNIIALLRTDNLHHLGNAIENMQAVLEDHNLECKMFYGGFPIYLKHD